MAFDLGSLTPLVGAGGGSAFMRGFQRAQQEALQRQQLEQQTQRQTRLDQQGAERETRIADQQQQQLMLQAETARRLAEQQRLGYTQDLTKLFTDESVDPDVALQLATMSPPEGYDVGAIQSMASKIFTPSERQRRAAVKRLGEIEKDPQIKKLIEAGEDLSTVAFEVPQLGPNPENPEGKPLWTIGKLREMAQRPVAATPLPKAAVAATEDMSKSSLQVQAAAALRRGDTEEYNRILRVQKEVNQADDRPQPQATVLIHTVDAQGNPVQQFVSKSPGATYAPAPTASQQTAMAEQEASIDQLNEIDRLYRPELVGPVVGRAARAQMQIPGAPDVPQDVAEFHASVAGLRNEIIRLISGAAVSGAEEARMRSQLPDVTDKPSVFQAKLSQTRRNRETLLGKMQARSGQPTGGRGSGAGPSKPVRKIGRFEVVEN